METADVRIKEVPENDVREYSHGEENVLELFVARACMSETPPWRRLSKFKTRGTFGC